MSEAQFLITVIKNDRNGHVTVEVESETEFFGFWVCAAEYLVDAAAKRSSLDYDEALCLLCRGARTYTQHDGEKIVMLRPRGT